jgi:hypothetical protein
LESSQVAIVQNIQTTKDDIVQLIHLYKELSAQKHWRNLQRIMTRAQLGSRKAVRVYGIHHILFS